MFFYIVLLCLSSVSAFCCSKAKTAAGTFVFKWTTFLILFVPAAFRYGIGFDYPNYERLFREIAAGGGGYVEPGYWYLNYVVIRRGGDFQIVIAVMSFFTAYFFIKGTPKRYFFLCIPVYVMVIYGSGTTGASG
jgi:hypothetical protein